MSNGATNEENEFWTRPVLHVTDLGRSLNYYCESLGFVKDWIDRGGKDAACAQVSRSGLAVILDEKAYFPKAALPSVLALTLNDTPESPRLDALHQEFVSAGGMIRNAPFKVNWDEHVCEMDVEDLDGNVLMFWGYMSENRH